MLNAAIEKLENILLEVPHALREISDSDSGHKPSSSQWSNKEILGHLIDSASNNHQRFIRCQYVENLSLQDYEQDIWVNVQRYNERPWNDIIELWTAYNKQICHVMRSVSEEHLNKKCMITGLHNEAVTLLFLMTDYVEHMQHHLNQIFVKHD